MITKKSTYSGPVLHQADILGFESHFGVKLPAGYVSFMLEYNGGVYSIKEIEDDPSDFFYSIVILEPIKTESEYKRFDSGGIKIPEGFLVIGRDNASNLACLLVDEHHSEFGSLWFHSHEGDEPDEGETEIINMWKESDNFEQYFARLLDEELYDNQ